MVGPQAGRFPAETSCSPASFYLFSFFHQSHISSASDAVRTAKLGLLFACCEKLKPVSSPLELHAPYSKFFLLPLASRTHSTVYVIMFSAYIFSVYLGYELALTLLCDKYKTL